MVVRPSVASLPPAQIWGGRVALIAKPGGRRTGVGRYVQMLEQGLSASGTATTWVAPEAPPLGAHIYASLQRGGVDLRTFLMNYPLWAHYPSADVYHLTSQNLATLLFFRRPQGRVVVTVHDIIPYLVRNDRRLCVYRTFVDRLFDGLAMRGLRRADHLIADSHYTRQTLIEHLRISPARISVVYLGIDHDRFQPRRPTPELRVRYGLPEGRRYLIYVGSEDPRKNLVTLLQALATLRTTHNDVELIKVGRAHFTDERRRLCELAAEWGVGHAIHWLDDVPEDDLPSLYSLADVGVLPSLYEGFGFPVLEAMACGTPVVCAAAASLPELAGEAAVLYDPEIPDLLTAALIRLLSDRSEYARRCLMGQKQAARFHWAQTVDRTRLCYVDDRRL